MEDSGIDSEDKFSSMNADFDPIEVQSPSTLNGNDEFEVSFRGGVSNKDTKHSGSKLNEIVSGHEEPSSPTSLDTELNTCRILQRKLELKVERAKRNYYSQHQEEPAKKTHSSTLIPINRLKIPGNAENEPLVDYKSDESEPEEMSFFPVKLKGSKHQSQELSDTFSLQEMTIEESDDSGVSQNLELLPPRSSRSLYRFFDKFCCCFGRRRKWFK
uniref:Uncharacterized protein n=1 Tax=Megaselia scalaris TaxID=36166 RepID=T1H4S8_MEGSC